LSSSEHAGFFSHLAIMRRCYHPKVKWEPVQMQSSYLLLLCGGVTGMPVFSMRIHQMVERAKGYLKLHLPGHALRTIQRNQPAVA